MTLDRAIDEAERLEVFDLRAVQQLCSRSHGRRGVAILRTALDRYQPAGETRSELEREFVRRCLAGGIPHPSVNRVVEGLEVDALWKAARLVVELDGFAFHKTRRAFERDRVRDSKLQLAGYRVLRITAVRLRDQPEEVVATIKSLLAV